MKTAIVILALFFAAESQAKGFHFHFGKALHFGHTVKIKGYHKGTVKNIKVAKGFSVR